MTTDQLRTNIKHALNQPDALNITERVILSTYLFNPAHETAFKLRLSIREVDKVITNFILKTKGTKWKNNLRTLDTSTHYLQNI